jgi:hypothetical protein
MKIMHHSKHLMVAQIDPKEIGYASSIPNYLTMTLASTGGPFARIESKVLGWNEAYKMIKIDKEWNA